MRKTITLLAFIVVLPGPGLAQAISNDMTCVEAVEHYEQDGSIYSGAGGDAFLVEVGVPVSRRDDLKCGEDEVAEPYFVHTSDLPNCLIAYQCTKADTSDAEGDG